MATMSVTSTDGVLESASAVLEVTSTNPDYNQPALRIKQAGRRGGAASIRIDDPNPDIELIETGLTGPDPGAGKFEIAVQADRLQINGRNASDTGFETVVMLQRLATGGNIGIRTTSQFGRGEGVSGDCECDCRPVCQSRRRRHYVCRGWGAQVSRIEWDRNCHRAGMSCDPEGCTNSDPVHFVGPGMKQTGADASNGLRRRLRARLVLLPGVASASPTRCIAGAVERTRDGQMTDLKHDGVRHAIRLRLAAREWNEPGRDEHVFRPAHR